MSKDPISISRHQMYEKVWTTPIAQLSKEYCISDVGLAKICRKYNIPRPYRGYCAKKSAGMLVDKTPLPQKNRKDVIKIWPNPDHGSDNNKSLSLKKHLPFLSWWFVH